MSALIRRGWCLLAHHRSHIYGAHAILCRRCDFSMVLR